MPFSKSWGYAVRAMLALAGEGGGAGERRQAAELAEVAGLPASFLSKLLVQLTAAGLLESTRGRGGGVRLAKPPGEISLYDIAAATDGFDRESPLPPGFEEAPESMRAALAHRWRPYHLALVEFLAETTLADLLRDLRSP